MAIQDTQKVDYLWKKLGYGRSKTDVNSVKAATNESIASPLLVLGFSQSAFTEFSVFLLEPFSVFRFCTPFGSFWLFMFVCGFIGHAPPSLRSEPVFIPPF